jgi:hypothetical protein
MRKIITVATLLACLAGCESVDRRLSDLQEPLSTTSGYIAGSFSGQLPRFDEGAHYAFVFKEEKSGKPYMLPFFGLLDRGEQSNKLKLVEVPPGRYVFSHWISYSGVTGQTLAESRQALGGLGTIEVARSRVTYVGAFKADDHFAGLGKARYVITPVAWNQEGVTQQLKAEYPGYALLARP